MNPPDDDALHYPKVSRARNTISRTAHDSWPAVDTTRLRAYRLARVRAELRASETAGLVIYDPVNLRYATGTNAMPVFTMHFPDRYCFVPVEGPVVMFEKPHWRHLSENVGAIDEVRPSVSCRAVTAGPDVELNVRRWVEELDELVRGHGGGSRRLALDRCEPACAFALAAAGIEVADGQTLMERARVIKSDDEIDCMNIAITVAETGMARMRAALEPGITENELWAILAHANIAMGGEWLECRLLTSGGRTNPWLQEASDRMVRAGELVAFDTDMIGPFGYCADISRTYFCEPGSPSPTQRGLYRLAYEEIHHNMALIKAGVSMRELAERAFVVPEAYAPNSYAFVAHGVGLCDEWPNCYRLERLERQGEGDVLLEAGMTLCVESYVGAIGGDEGVKLEQQVLVTEEGFELLSTFPFEDSLLGQVV